MIKNALTHEVDKLVTRMIVKISNQLSVIYERDPLISACAQDTKYSPFETLNTVPTKVIIKGEIYDIIPNYEMIRICQNNGGYFRLIYIQIDMTSGEYYVGKVNRHSWREILRYQGSGIRFCKKFNKHRSRYVRYYIASCDSAAETEELEAHIVDNALLSDPKCLNLVSGGGGTNVHPTREETKKKLRNYMMKHPEQSQAMLEVNRKVFCSGDTAQLRERNEKIRKTMSAQTYRDMFSQRIKNWREENPEAYAASRIKNKLAQSSPETLKKRAKSREKWNQEHPVEYELYKKRLVQAQQSQEAREKRKSSLKKWTEENPEQAADNRRKRAKAAAKVLSKQINMLDLETSEVLRTFDSQHEAARWLVEQGIAKNTNCVSSISAVCLKKPCTTGYGYRTKAYGYGWEFSKSQTAN